MSIARQRKKRYAELEALYARLPQIECQGLCWSACGPIAMARIEWIRIEEMLGQPMPLFPPGDPAEENLLCPLLDPETKRCTVYNGRPAICRLWGVAEQLPCPHGCKLTGTVTLAETGPIIKAIIELSGTDEPIWLAPEGWRERIRAGVLAYVAEHGPTLPVIHEGFLPFEKTL